MDNIEVKQDSIVNGEGKTDYSTGKAELVALTEKQAMLIQETWKVVKEKVTLDVAGIILFEK